MRERARHPAAGLVLPALLLTAALSPSALAQPGAVKEPWTVHIFYDHDIHFSPVDSARYDDALVTASDKGRVISRTIELHGSTAHPVRITAHVAVRPIAKNAEDVHDKWDRAANVRLARPGMPDIEVVKFITAYGGVSAHDVDVTHLAPLLTGSCTFKGFVDTWVSPAWKMDFSLLFEPVADDERPDWVQGLLYEENLNADRLSGGGVMVDADIPRGTTRVVMNVLASGHCTDGRGADEFVTKDNVIMVDGEEVYRFQPWRDDCRQYRAVNPYCRRWSDGTWSSDYSRSGWCPSDKVLPLSIDLSAHLTPGNHSIIYMIQGVRPRDDEGHYGYWRVSSHLLGWSE